MLLKDRHLICIMIRKLKCINDLDIRDQCDEDK